MDDILLPGDDTGMALTGGGAAMTAEQASLAVRMAESEVNLHIATAHRFPRSNARALANIVELVTLDPATAEECIYALPRDGKALRGPSIRFAEIVASQWGNCHIGSRIVEVDRENKVVIAEGVFWDLQTGMKRVVQTRRSIATKKGGLFSADMIVVTGNAGASIALRNAILAGVPKPVWRRAYDEAEKVLKGDAQTLSDRRNKAMDAWGKLGISDVQIYGVLGVEGFEDINLDHLATLRAMLRAINAAEADLTTYFPEGPQANKAPAPRVAKAAEAPKAPAATTPAPKADTAQKAAPAAPAHDPSPGAVALAAQKAAQAKATSPAGTPHDPETGEVQEPTGTPTGSGGGAEITGDDDGPESGEAPQSLARLYEEINDASFAGGVSATRAHYAAELERMKREDPAMFDRLNNELDALEASGG